MLIKPCPASNQLINRYLETPHHAEFKSFARYIKKMAPGLQCFPFIGIFSDLVKNGSIPKEIRESN
uniref:Uncharacterized protein n=1 Tax=Anguilla anguilla TaxID=7936 RepID=A0A0E9UY41_ANGAN